MKFNQIGLKKELEEGLEMMGFETTTPIQEKVIPLILEGKDVIACAQTGTGKTAAFVLPILSLLSEQKNNSSVKAIIITPTRELAKQIDMQIEGFSYYTNSSSYPIYGGGTGPEFENQKQALLKGTDIIICTPGRLLAHLKFDYFNTNTINYLILDEANLDLSRSQSINPYNFKLSHFFNFTFLHNYQVLLLSLQTSSKTCEPCEHDTKT